LFWNELVQRRDGLQYGFSATTEPSATVAASTTSATTISTTATISTAAFTDAATAPSTEFARMRTVRHERRKHEVRRLLRFHSFTKHHQPWNLSLDRCSMHE
jgi:hypothetical protein